MIRITSTKRNWKEKKREENSYNSSYQKNRSKQEQENKRTYKKRNYWFPRMPNFPSRQDGKRLQQMCHWNKASTKERKIQTGWDKPS